MLRLAEFVALIRELEAPQSGVAEAAAALAAALASFAGSGVMTQGCFSRSPDVTSDWKLEGDCASDFVDCHYINYTQTN